MSSSVESESIQLHFCQRCGISIPQNDIDTGRAQAAPGGYVCSGCSYAEVASARGRAPAARSDSNRVLVLLALLYVVGVSTFLLVKEVRREAPAPVDLADVASVEAVRGLAQKVERLDGESRTAAAALRANDEQARENLAELASRVNTLSLETTKFATGVRGDVEDLYKLALEISKRRFGSS